MALLALAVGLAFVGYNLRSVVLKQEWWQKQETAKYVRFQSMESLYDSPEHGFAALDNNGHILEWNKGMETLTGYSREEMIGKPFDLVVPPERRWRYSRGFRSLLASERKSGGDPNRWVIQIPKGVVLNKAGERLFVTGRVQSNYSEVDDYSYAMVLMDRYEDVVRVQPLSEDIREESEKEALSQ